MPVEVSGNSPILNNPAIARAGAVEFVSAADFRDKVLNGQGPIAVEFMSFGCGYCRLANPMVHDVATALAGRVKVYQVNVPVDIDLARKYRIEGTPTFVMFQNGRELSRANPQLTPYGIRQAITGPFGL